jgi:hypothetical protein
MEVPENEPKMKTPNEGILPAHGQLIRRSDFTGKSLGKPNWSKEVQVEYRDHELARPRFKSLNFHR